MLNRSRFKQAWRVNRIVINYCMPIAMVIKMLHFLHINRILHFKSSPCFPCYRTTKCRCIFILESDLWVLLKQVFLARNLDVNQKSCTDSTEKWEPRFSCINGYHLTWYSWSIITGHYINTIEPSTNAELTSYYSSSKNCSCSSSWFSCDEHTRLNSETKKLSG